MFKLLYKTILISFISCSLMTMNLRAYAQDAAVTAPEPAVGSHKFKATSNDNMISTITMLAVGAVGTKLLLYKKWTPDMMAAVAGSAIYILGEIANLMALKDQVKETTIDVTNGPDGKPDQTQIAELEKLKKSYQAVRKSGKIKKMLQMAAAAAYGVALGIAVWQLFTEEGQYASCEAAIANATSVLTGCTTSTIVAASEAAGCAACQVILQKFNADINVSKASAEIPGPSAAQAAVASIKGAIEVTENAATCPGATAAGVKSTVTGACSPYIVTKKIDNAFGVVPTITSNSNWINKTFFAGIDLPNNKMSIDPTAGSRNFLQKILDVFMPRAEAGIMSMLGLGAGAAAVFFTTQTAFGKMIDTFMFTPKKRMIVWGVMAAAALAGSMATQSEMDKVDENIKKIDQILGDLNALQSGVALNNAAQIQIPDSNNNVQNGIIGQQLTNPQTAQYQSIPLGTGASTNANVNVTSDCLASSGNSNCASLSNALTSMPGFNDLPPSLQSSLSQTALLGNGLSGTSAISGSTLAGGRSLASNQAAITKLANSIKNKLNDALAKNGKPKINFTQGENALWNQMKAQTNKTLKSNGMSADSFLVNTGISPSASTATAAAIPSYKPNTSGLTGAAIAPTRVPRDDDKENPLDGKGAEAETKDETKDEIKDAKFDIGTNDINTNSSDSIFQLISNRYLKSGYSKLFTKIPEKK